MCLMLIPGMIFQPILMFVDKAISLPQSRSPERCFIWAGSHLTQKQ